MGMMKYCQSQAKDKLDKKIMKICFFTENYRKGGVDTFLINLFNAWPKTEDELTLVCNAAHAGLATIIEKTTYPVNIVKYKRIFTSRLAHGQITSILAFPIQIFFALLFRVLQYPIVFPWYILTLTLFFRQTNFERLMVVNGGYPASLLCRSAAIAWKFSGKSSLAIFNFHSSANQAPWYFRKLEDFIDKMVVNSVDKIVGVSQATLNSLKVRKYFRECDKLFYIFNGIEDPLSRLSLMESGLKTKGHNSQYCLMLATYEVYKGHSFLFKSFKRVVKEFPSIRLHIYGFGTAKERNRVANEVKRYGLDDFVVLNGFTTQTAQLYLNAQLLTVPSQAYEAFGLTIIEAMAYGLPAVVTDVGGMPELLANSHAGYVCSKDDSEEFANRIIYILRNPAIAKELGRNGRRIFEERFTALKMAQEYSFFIRKGS